MAGFQTAVSGGEGRAALIEWMTALAAAPEGTMFEVGLTWTPEHKWRVYQRIGDKVLMLHSEQARKLFRIYDKMRARPEWRDISDSMMDTLGALNVLASEAYRNNQAGIVPEGGVEYMQPKGNG